MSSGTSFQWTRANYEQFESETNPLHETRNPYNLHSLWVAEGNEPLAKLLERAVTPAIVCILCAVALAGNALVFAAFAWERSLRTITNAFLLSLAAADIVVAAVSMPLFALKHAIGVWPFGSLLCDLWLAIDYTASNASVVNLLVISLDRYLSVTRPITYRAHRTWTVAGCAIGGSWAMSLALWAPAIFLWPILKGRNVPASECRIEFLEKSPTLTVATAVCAYYLPVSIMCALYLRVYIETRRRRHTLFALQAVASIPLSHSMSYQRCTSDASSLRHPLIERRVAPPKQEPKRVVSPHAEPEPEADTDRDTTTCSKFVSISNKRVKDSAKKKFSARRQQWSASRMSTHQTQRTATAPFFAGFCEQQASANIEADSRQVTPSRFIALCTCHSHVASGKANGSGGNGQWIERTLSLTQVCGCENEQTSSPAKKKQQQKQAERSSMGRQWTSCTSLRSRANTVPSTEREDADRFARRTENLLMAISSTPTATTPITSPVSPPTRSTFLRDTSILGEVALLRPTPAPTPTETDRSPRSSSGRVGMGVGARGFRETVRRLSSFDGGAQPRDRVLSGASSSFKQKQLRQQAAAREQQRKRSEYRAAKTLSAILFVFIGYWMCYANSALNPFIYAACNERFRCAYRELLSAFIGLLFSCRRPKRFTRERNMSNAHAVAFSIRNASISKRVMEE